MLVCAAPPGCTRLERAYWNYYAPLLAAERRLTMKARDTLAKYCTALAVVTGLRRSLASRRPKEIAVRDKTRKELRQWVLAARLYENDLILNPASAIRAPKEDVPPPIPPGAPVSDFDTEFDADDTVN